ncbi:MAG: hypothetical protein ACRDYV_07265 [Acidimicrobiia bacterium]
MVSHTEPVEGGIQAESVTVLRQVEAGPLLIQTLVSRAMAFVPSQGGEPTGIASTVVEGATVGGQPVQITDQGVVASEEPSSLNQEAVNKAFADGGFEQVRLLPSSAVSSDEGQAVFADAGVLEFVKQDQAFGASNPQGFSGGGFAFGGATAGISTVRCFPDCPEGLGLPDDPVSGDGDIPSLPADSSDPESSGTDPSSASGDPSFASGVTTTPVDAGLSTDAGSGLSYAADNYLSGGGLSLPTGPSLDYSSTTAYTPPDLNTATGGAQQAAAPLVNQQVALASSGLGPEEADWVRDLYLGVGVAAGVLFVGSRLAQAFR